LQIKRTRPGPHGGVPTSCVPILVANAFCDHPICSGTRIWIKPIRSPASYHLTPSGRIAPLIPHTSHRAQRLIIRYLDTFGSAQHVCVGHVLDPRGAHVRTTLQLKGLKGPSVLLFLCLCLLRVPIHGSRLARVGLPFCRVLLALCPRGHCVGLASDLVGPRSDFGLTHRESTRACRGARASVA
jgi:hypothetical protein